MDCWLIVTPTPALLLASLLCIVGSTQAADLLDNGDLAGRTLILDLTAADLVGRHLIGEGRTVWCGPWARAARGSTSPSAARAECPGA